MTIKMPPSYIEITKLKHMLEPCTWYNISKIPTGVNPYYHLADTKVPCAPRGSFKLMYALKSYPHNTDNSRYMIFFITTQGLYIDERQHAQYDEPIHMRNINARFLSKFGQGDLCVNMPHKRNLLFIYDVTYDEIIGNKSYPNAFDYFSHKDDKELGNLKHQLVIHGHNILMKPVDITLDWHPDLYRALQHRQMYLHLREDNYINMRNIRFWNPTF